jgi:hypothetical protein
MSNLQAAYILNLGTEFQALGRNDCSFIGTDVKPKCVVHTVDGLLLNTVYGKNL